MKSIKKLNLKNKNVFIRCDFNVPLEKGKITDDYRIVNSLKTIKYVLSQKPSRIVLGSHLGRPKGYDAKYSLNPVAKKLSELLKKTVYLHANPLAPIEAKSKIVLLENLRFFEGEKKGSLSFAKQLAQHADVYINDAFGTAHRKDASVYALAKLLPCAPGLLMEKEIELVNLNHPRPIVAIFGAAKIADKLPLLKKLFSKVDKVVIGGATVFTFLQAMGLETGKSLVEKEMVFTAKKLIKKYPGKIVLPVDVVVASPKILQRNLKDRKEHSMTVSVDKIPKTKAGYDVGLLSVKLFTAVIQSAHTVVWNGPLGMFETKPYDHATKKLAKEIEKSSAVSIICGGDTASAVREFKFTHVSTGGGASLQLLAGLKLPAIQALNHGD